MPKTDETIEQYFTRNYDFKTSTDGKKLYVLVKGAQLHVSTETLVTVMQEQWKARVGENISDTEAKTKLSTLKGKIRETLSTFRRREGEDDDITEEDEDIIRPASAAAAAGAGAGGAGGTGGAARGGRTTQRTATAPERSKTLSPKTYRERAVPRERTVQKEDPKDPSDTLTPEEEQQMRSQMRVDNMQQHLVRLTDHTIRPSQTREHTHHFPRRQTQRVSVSLPSANAAGSAAGLEYAGTGKYPDDITRYFKHRQVESIGEAYDHMSRLMYVNRMYDRHGLSISI